MEEKRGQSRQGNGEEVLKGEEVRYNQVKFINCTYYRLDWRREVWVNLCVIKMNNTLYHAVQRWENICTSIKWFKIIKRNVRVNIIHIIDYKMPTNPPSTRHSANVDTCVMLSNVFDAGLTLNQHCFIWMLWIMGLSSKTFRNFHFFHCEIDFRRQNLTFIGVRFWHLKSIPTLKGLAGTLHKYLE